MRLICNFRFKETLTSVAGLCLRDAGRAVIVLAMLATAPSSFASMTLSENTPANYWHGFMASGVNNNFGPGHQIDLTNNGAISEIKLFTSQYEGGGNIQIHIATDVIGSNVIASSTVTLAEKIYVDGTSRQDTWTFTNSSVGTTTRIYVLLASNTNKYAYFTHGDMASTTIGHVITGDTTYPQDGFPAVEWTSPNDLEIVDSTAVPMSVRYYNPPAWQGGPGFYSSIHIRGEGGIIGEYATSSDFAIATTSAWTTLSWTYPAVASTTYVFYASGNVGGSLDTEKVIRFSVLEATAGYESMFGYSPTSSPSDYISDGCNNSACSISDLTGCMKKSFCWAFVPDNDSWNSFKTAVDPKQRTAFMYVPTIFSWIKSVWTPTNEKLDDIYISIPSEIYGDANLRFTDWADLKTKTAEAEEAIETPLGLFLTLLMIFYFIDVGHRLSGAPHASGSVQTGQGPIVDLRRKTRLSGYQVTIPKRK